MYNELECSQYEAAESSCEERRCERLVCTNLVIGFLFALLAFTVGLIVACLQLKHFRQLCPCSLHSQLCLRLSLQLY